MSEWKMRGPHVAGRMCDWHSDGLEGTLAEDGSGWGRGRARNESCGVV